MIVCLSSKSPLLFLTLLTWNGSLFKHFDNIISNCKVERNNMCEKGFYSDLREGQGTSNLGGSFSNVLFLA